MPQSVYITAPIEPIEASVKHLRIPKTRQKELLAILDRAWARHARVEEAPANRMTTKLVEAAEQDLELMPQVETGKKNKSASAA